jgi:hypothetical protein
MLPKRRDIPELYGVTAQKTISSLLRLLRPLWCEMKLSSQRRRPKSKLNRDKHSVNEYS